ncbi:MAG TPA: alpha-1,2-fucosyltransferase [Saprospiraceae bacterium]|nr:alpha-1,2-fucosyltransferase [Saprospiraceae bacterium]
MLIFFESGRLGNQVFQVAFLNTIRGEKERIILVGFNEFFETFQRVPFTWNIPVKKNAFSLLFIKLVSDLLYFVSGIGLISFIEQRKEPMIDGSIGRGPGSIRKKGLLSNLTLVRQGYFQGESFLTMDAVKKIQFKENIRKQADQILLDLPPNKKRIFIHIRRGDYRNLSIYGVSGVDLPTEYYLTAINMFDLSTTYFIVCSDEDVELPVEIENIHYKSNHAVNVDLALMASCDGGILSNSSLSWWGAYLQDSGNAIIAPRFWLGYKSKEYYPKGIYVANWHWIECS